MSRVVFAAVIVVAVSSSVCFGYSGGSGTKEAPYQIANKADLLELADAVEDYNKCFILTADANMEGQVFTTAILVKAPYINQNGFRGVFDGNNHKITNFTINGGSGDCLGLFGYCQYPSRIKNLGLENYTVSSSNSVYVGSLVGANFGKITGCYATGSVNSSSDSYTGGLVGQNYNGIIINCYSTGDVNGISKVGGLAGENYYRASIISCYSTGAVSGDSNVGGLVGNNLSETGISNCYSTGDVNGTFCVGGLVGRNYLIHSYGWEEQGIISGCYSTGEVIGDSNVGGLVGYNNINDYVFNSFWDTETSGQSTSAGGEGKTTSEMQDANTFLTAGWDFINETANGTCNYWLTLEGGGYPVLSALNGSIPPELSGSGTEEEPYIITDINDIGTIWYRPSAHYVLANDINLGGIQWAEAVVPVFDGVFDGNSVSINNLSINGEGSHLGLFGRLVDGQLRNLGLENCTVAGSGLCFSGLAGYNEFGSINNCYSTGTINCNSNAAGGLVGVNGGSMSNCYSAADVNGTSNSRNIGGLVGSNDRSISNCYATGAVSGTSEVGGLAGTNGNDADISNCYSIGAVSGDSNVGGLIGLGSSRCSVLNSFWDTETSGQITSAGGEGKTTTEMQDANTFADAGWDFINETGNGTCNYWQTPTGGGCPVFSILNGYIPAELAGSGTEGNPYIITDANDLGTIWYRSSSHYELGNDINLVGIQWSAAVAPVFNGVFDGNGFNINNLFISGGGFLGLFGSSYYNSEVKNLRLEKCTINGNCSYTGSLTGCNYGNIDNCYSAVNVDVNAGYIIGGLVGINTLGNIHDCHCTGTVSSLSGYGFGGLAGYNSYGSMRNCSSTADVNSGLSGYAAVGGLVGSNPYGNINNCYSTGKVSSIGMLAGGLVGSNNFGNICDCHSTSEVNGGGNVGGLVGRVYLSGTVRNCYATGATSGSSAIGGLAGFNYGKVSDCYSTGDVNGTSSVGGLVGGNQGSISNCYSKGTSRGIDGNYQDSHNIGGLVGENYSSISNCYSRGDVNGTSVVGGLVGRNYYVYSYGDTEIYQGGISNCYSTGVVIGDSNVGGLVGYNGDSNDSNVVSSFWDTETSGQGSSGGGKGKTTVEMQTKSTFTDADWDFTDIWDICEGTNYPKLVWSIPAADFVCPDGVDFVDFAVLANTWLLEDGELEYNPVCDISIPADEIINMLDLYIFVENWMAGK